MKRRDFLKITMGTLGSAMGIKAATAALPVLAEENKFGSLFEGKPILAKGGLKLDNGPFYPNSMAEEIDKDILKQIEEMAKVMDAHNIPMNDRKTVLPDGRVISLSSKGRWKEAYLQRKGIYNGES